MSLRRCASVAMLALALSALSIHAQRPESDPPVCLGFAFGAWTPPLNWRGAGHGPKPDTSALQHAPAGRDWAANMALGAGPSDSLLILFPAWWPAGVSVDLPTRNPSVGDTVVGRARAFIADGRQTTPTSRVRAWRVACAR